MTRQPRQLLVLALSMTATVAVAQNMAVMAIFAATSARPVAMSAWFGSYAALGFALGRLAVQHVRSHAIRGVSLPLCIALTGGALSVAGLFTNFTLLFASGTGAALPALVVLWPRVWRWLRDER
jgi:hypothetical protein